MKKSLAIILVLCLALGLMIGGCGAKSDDKSAAPGNSTETKAPADNSWNDIKAKGSFTVGLDDAFAPMGFRDEKNNIVGFDVDMAKEAAKRLGIDVKFQPINWDTKVAELNGGNIDCIWNGLTITDELQKQIQFTAPYMSDHQIIVVTADAKIKSKADLAGKKIGIQAGSSAISAVQADKATYEKIKNDMLEFKDNQLALNDLKGGGVQAVVVDEVVGRYTMSKDPKSYKVLSDNFGTEDFGVGLRMKDKAFKDQLEKVLNDMKADGAAAKISKKWFGEDIIKK